MHLSSKLPVNARDVIENAGYETRVQNAISFQRGSEKKEGSDLSLLFVGQLEGRGHFLLPSIDRFSVKAYLPT